MTKKRIPEDDVVRIEERKAIAQRRVGDDARCEYCGESRPEALVAGSNPMTCAECQRNNNRQSPVEKHHVAGENNSPITAEIMANDHRAVLSVAQYKWPSTTLHNPKGDPIIAIAAWLRGTADTIIYLVQKFVIAAAECLEKVANYLTTTMGEQYWLDTPLAVFAPKR